MNANPVKLAVALTCLAAGSAWAVEYGTVVSSTQVVQAVPVSQRECIDQPVVYQHPSSGAGALIGAIAGGAIANSLGSGAGRAMATGIGVVTGAAIGDRVEANGTPPVTSTVQRCRNVTRYENRVVGFDVVYDFQGVRRSVRMAQDPGERIALEIAVTPVGTAAPDRVAVAAAPAAPVYLTPGDGNYPQAAPQIIYAPPPVYANPWPYVVIGGLYGAYGGWGWGGGYRPYVGYGGYANHGGYGGYGGHGGGGHGHH